MCRLKFPKSQPCQVSMLRYFINIVDIVSKTKKWYWNITSPYYYVSAWKHKYSMEMTLKVNKWNENMLKYVISFISDLLDYFFEDAVKPQDNVTVSERFNWKGLHNYSLIRETLADWNAAYDT